MNRFILLFLSFIYSCSTIVGQDLKNISAPKISDKRSKLIVYSPFSAQHVARKNLQEYLEETNLFQEVKVLEYYKYPTKDEVDYYDVSLKLNFVSEGFFEPYCFIFLTIIPCTPPLFWNLGAEITTNDKQMNYFVKEEARELIWAFGPIFKRFGKGEVKRSELYFNMLNHILMKFREDQVI